jgi:hypothetical protein
MRLRLSSTCDLNSLTWLAGWLDDMERLSCITKNSRFRSYRNEVWDLIDIFFLAFNISFIPRGENTVTDSLAISTRNFRVPLPPKLRYNVEVIYIPSIPNNVKHWKVFEDDIEIKRFLETVDEFSALHIDQDPDPEINPHTGALLKKITDHHIVQFPNNHIPKGLVPLEILFDKMMWQRRVKYQMMMLMQQSATLAQRRSQSLSNYQAT